MRTAALLGLVIGGHTGFAHAAQTPPKAPPEVRMLEKVTVSGVRPGPGLWKVSKGDHTLWILGLVSPIPKKMEWYSPQSEARLRHTQEIIGQPQFAAMIGWGGAFKMAFAMPTILRARKNPDGKSLREVLPADLYARWLPLKSQYLHGDKSIEEWRPLFAAAKLVREMGMQDAIPRAQQKWLVAVDAALAANETTFSMLPMNELLASDGLLARLQAKGYVIEAPQ